MPKFATKKAAREILDRYKRETNYFPNVAEEHPVILSLADMKDMLRNRMEFGEAETNVILASLVLAGAKFSLD